MLTRHRPRRPWSAIFRGVSKAAVGSPTRFSTLETLHGIVLLIKYDRSPGKVYPKISSSSVFAICDTKQI